MEEKKEELVENSEQKEENKGNKILTIVAVLLGVVVLVVGGIFGYKKLTNKEEKTDNKKYEEEVKIDASLATQPLTDAYMEGLDNFNIKADYSNTDPAYTKLINKEVDLIVVTEPSEDELERAKKAGVELVVTPVVNEGFVFYTNINNPVDSLTFEEIQKIYTGEITNWKTVGGDDASIIAYQRPANSGSQTGILSLVMKNLKMKEPTKAEYINTMAGIIDVVANYENGKDAIGYSYYYYATTMYGNDKLKFLGVDGVVPNHDTIKDETYPIITSYYIVTIKGDDREAVVKLKEAMLSKRGQEIAKNAGYVELS